MDRERKKQYAKTILGGLSTYGFKFTGQDEQRMSFVCKYYGKWEKEEDITDSSPVAEIHGAINADGWPVLYFRLTYGGEPINQISEMPRDVQYMIPPDTMQDISRKFKLFSDSRNTQTGIEKDDAVRQTDALVSVVKTLNTLNQ